MPSGGPPRAAAALPLLLLLLAAAALLPAAHAAAPTPPPPGFDQRLGGRPRRPAQIGTSVVQTSLWDLEGDAGGGRSVCETVVDRSVGYGTTAIALVLTVEARGYEGGLEQYFYKGEREERGSDGRTERKKGKNSTRRDSRGGAR